MKPIDVIRGKLDKDLLKYHNCVMCCIPTKEDIKDIKGIGLLAMVVPLREYLQGDVPGESVVGQRQKFPVFIANRTSGWFDWGLERKCNVLVLSPVKDRVSLSIGFLIPKNLIEEESAWINGIVNKDKALKDDNGNSVGSSTTELLSPGKSG